MRIHDLRHTFASLLIHNGESLAYVKDQLGHHSIQITVETYGHLVPGGNRHAVDRLDDPAWGSHGSKMVAEGFTNPEEDQLSAGKDWSHPADSNRRPTDYECVKGHGPQRKTSYNFSKLNLQGPFFSPFFPPFRLFPKDYLQPITLWDCGGQLYLA